MARCSWNGIDCHGASLTKFLYKFLTVHYGNCLAFNDPRVAANNLSVGMSGPTLGLSLDLMVDGIDYLGNGLTQDAGFRVAIISPGQPIVMEDLGFNIAPGETFTSLITYLL